MKTYAVLFIVLFLCSSLTVAEDVSRKAGDRLTLQVNGVEFAFRWCPSGTFTMGSPESEQREAIQQSDMDAERKFAKRKDREEYKVTRRQYIREEAQHQVQLTRGFYLQERETTQQQWEAVKGGVEKKGIPAYLAVSDFPMVLISYEDCVDFADKLNKLNIAPTGFRFVLPTEAQWEYGCRAGTTTAYSFGAMLNGKQANCDGSLPFGTKEQGKRSAGFTKSGTFPANPWGLFDMHGNLWEWCQDWYGSYPKDLTVDPKGPETGKTRVYRGGSWQNRAGSCRSAYRPAGIMPSDNYIRCGMRLALVDN